MVHFGEGRRHVLAVGTGSVEEALSEWNESADTAGLSVTAVGPAAVDGTGTMDADCLVIDGGEVEPSSADLTASLRQDHPEVPLVTLYEAAASARATDALSAGATHAMPRAVLDEHPRTLAEKVSAAIERHRGRSGFQELFDTVAAMVTVHDPDSGAVLDGNRRLCERLGYDRSELRSLEMDDLTADIPEYDGRRARTLVESVTEQSDPIEVEWPLETADGAVCWVESTVDTATVGSRTVVLWSATDITERRRRERTHEAVFDNVNDVITVHDPWSERIVDANDALCELTGFDRQTVLDMDIDGLRSGVGEDVYDIQQRVSATGAAETIEWRLETAAGDERILEMNLTPATIAGEDRIVAISRDITERRELERTYKGVFENVSDGLVVHDPETGRIREVNDRFCEMNGYSRDRLVGETVDIVTGPDHTPEEARERIEAAREEGPQLFEWQNQRADGDTFPVEVHLSVTDIRGQEQVLASVRDITERKRREREYEQIFNGVNDIINVYDPETMELIEVNDRTCELTGYDRETLLRGGPGLVSATGEGYTEDRASDIMASVRDSGDPQEVEWCLETAEGDHRWLEVNVTPAVINGERRLLAISRDVTERRRSERRLAAILDRIDEAVFLTRADEIATSPSTEPDYISAGYEDIWGQSFETIREQYEEGFFGTLHPEDRGDYWSFVERVVEEIEHGDAADSYSHEYRIERPDGQRRWVRSDYYPLEYEAGAPRIVIVSRDITERKARERRIASFEEATDGLATAATPEEATRMAVDGATETLDLPAVGVYLYDDETGVLRPEVLTDALSGSVDAIEPGDDPLWQAFATGTLVTPDTRSEDSRADADGSPGLFCLDSWRGFPLGNHGVLVVGAPDSTVDSETIQASHVLAATLEAALNHLEGQQKLARQEEQLRVQTERAERLDRIARLTQQVESAITQASEVGDVERAVCERLANSGPYDLAWVGGVDVGEDRITAHATVGAPAGYVGDLDLTTRGETDAHPAVRAWQTDGVAVADSIISDGPSGEWRRRVLTEGYQSLCAVPLSYDGITHGILTVGADSPNAFDEREREVLEQLGTSIGYALAAIERRRALESDETVELEFTGEGTGLPFARAATEADCRVRYERSVTRKSGGVTVSFTFEGDGTEGVPGIAARTLPGDVEVVAESGTETVIEMESSDWFGSPLAEYGAVLRDATATPEETTITVEVPVETDIRAVADRLQEMAPTLELMAKRHHRGDDRTSTELGTEIEEMLTDRQLEVVRTALSAGYFEWPRENDGNEVASRLGITQPTLNKHLRLAEQQIFAHLFE